MLNNSFCGTVNFINYFSLQTSQSKKPPKYAMWFFWFVASLSGDVLSFSPN
jgi:hypothetical protein